MVQPVLTLDGWNKKKPLTRKRGFSNICRQKAGKKEAAVPIYEYECIKCGEMASILVSRHEDPEELACNSCGSKNLKRIISRVNFHLPQGDRLASYTSGDERNESYYRDSRNIGLRAEQMLKKAGVDPGDSFKAKLDNLRSDPSRVLKD
jgi:putative FmdB family regulatory protein